MLKHLQLQKIAKQPSVERNAHRKTTTTKNSPTNKKALLDKDSKALVDLNFLPSVATSPKQQQLDLAAFTTTDQTVTGATMPQISSKEFKAIKMRKHDLKIGDDELNNSVSQHNSSSHNNNGSSSVTNAVGNSKVKQDQQSLGKNRSSVIQVNQKRNSSLASGNSSIDSETKRRQQLYSKNQVKTAQGVSQNSQQRDDGFSQHLSQTTKNGPPSSINTRNENVTTANQATKHKINHTFANLPQTATALPNHNHHHNNHNQYQNADQFTGQRKKETTSRRKNVDLTYTQNDGLVISAPNEALSIDQDSSQGGDQSQLMMTSMFDPKINIKMAQMATHGSVNFPKLNQTDTTDAFNSIHGSWQGMHHKPAFLTTKNSLFSKQSNSLVTQEDHIIQDLKTNESVNLVRQLLKPRDFGRNTLERTQVRFKRTVDNKPSSIFLRRTSSALMTKYSRKFLTNMQVRPTVKPIGQQVDEHERKAARAASLSLPYQTSRQIDRHKSYHFRQLNTTRINNDSIYTIGEAENSQTNLPFPTYRSPQSNSNNSGENSRSNSNERLAQPSYQEPTVTAQRKQSKDINRIHISKALQAMRLAQLKQSLLKTQNVNLVCQDLISMDRLKQDKDLNQFGRQYLTKLYSTEREANTTIGVGSNSFAKKNQMSLTMQSFSIGPRSNDQSMDSYHQGRGGGAAGFKKNLSLQPSPINYTNNIGGNFTNYGGASPVNGIIGSGQPFKPGQHVNADIGNDLNQRQPFRESVLTNQGFEMREEDSLMQDFVEFHQDPTNQKQIFVTLEGELGQSFIQYLAHEIPGANHFIGSTVLGESQFENGIQGIQKPITMTQSPRSKLKMVAKKVDKQALEKIQKIATLAPLPTQDGNDPNMTDETPKQSDLKMNVPIVIKSGQKKLDNQQMRVNTIVDDQSLGSADQSIIDQSRLHTGKILTAYDGPLTDRDVASKLQLETQQEPVRKHKKQKNGQRHHLQDHKHMQKAVEQKIELFESFGMDDKQSNFKYQFEDTNNINRPPSTKQRKSGAVLNNMDAAMRESFERKVVPILANASHLLADGLTSHGGDDPTTFENVSSQDQSKLHQHDNSSKSGGGRIRLTMEQQMELESQLKKNLLGNSTTSIIHSPSIKTSSKRKMKLVDMAPVPIDITMTNYAIDKDTQGSPISTSQLSPVKKNPDTKSPQHRVKETQALLQQAQLDPNSFLHTQPIHYDNYYVQARPLAKTIFSNQYKQAQEKAQQTRKKQELISKKRVLRLSLEKQKQRSQDSSPEIVGQQDLRIPYHFEQKLSALDSMPGLKENKLGSLPDTRQGSQRDSSKILDHDKKHNSDFESQMTILKKDFQTNINQSDAAYEEKRVATSGTLNEPHENFAQQSQMTDKDIIITDQVPTSSTRQLANPSDMIQTPSKIITEVQMMRSIKKLVSPTKRVSPTVVAPKTNKNAQRMTVVQNVQMDELLLNGLSVQDDNLTDVNPLSQTQRQFAKFKGKSPIGSKGPNFLNRQKKTQTNGNESSNIPSTIKSTTMKTQPVSPQNQTQFFNSSGALFIQSVQHHQTLNVTKKSPHFSKTRNPQNSSIRPPPYEGTPTPDAIEIKPYRTIEMLKTQTLTRPQAANRTHFVKTVSQDITQAIQVAQNYNDTSNNVTSSHVMITNSPSPIEQFKFGSQTLGLKSPLPNTQRGSKIEEISRVEQAPSPLSIESDSAMRHLTKKSLPTGRFENAEGVQTRIKQRRDNEDLIQVQQIDKSAANSDRIKSDYQDDANKKKAIVKEKLESDQSLNQRLNESSHGGTAASHK